MRPRHMCLVVTRVGDDVYCGDITPSGNSVGSLYDCTCADCVRAYVTELEGSLAAARDHLATLAAASRSAR